MFRLELRPDKKGLAKYLAVLPHFLRARSNFFQDTDMQENTWARLRESRARARVESRNLAHVFVCISVKARSSAVCLDVVFRSEFRSRSPSPAVQCSGAFEFLATATDPLPSSPLIVISRQRDFQQRQCKLGYSDETQAHIAARPRPHPHLVLHINLILESEFLFRSHAERRIDGDGGKAEGRKARPHFSIWPKEFGPTSRWRWRAVGLVHSC